jgi:rare lipoprotein A
MLMSMARNGRLAAVLALTGCLAACASARDDRQSAPLTGTMKPYVVNGKRYVPKTVSRYSETGVASLYAPDYACQRTANGELFDGRSLSAAHKTLPLPSTVEVTNLANGRRVRVRVNDRGPFVKSRLIDLSPAAADRLGFSARQTERVKVRYVGPAPVATAAGRRCR